MESTVVIGLLLTLSVVSVTPNVDMGDENKLSFCAMLINRRVYKQENLEIFCLLKVQHWENQVRL